MPWTVDTSGFLKGLGQELQTMGKAQVKDQRNRAERIRADMAAHAPRDPANPDLPEHITVEEGHDARGRPYFDVGTSDADAFYQEFGTRFQTGHPFARAAVAKESR